MTRRHRGTRVTIRFEARLPHARWGPLFHVFRLEQPDVRLDWKPGGHPTRDRSLLDGADVGLFIEPPHEPGLVGVTLDASPMVVIVAAGDPLAHHAAVRAADILHRPFPGSPTLDPEWTSFWTLNEQRGSPPELTDDDVKTAEDALQVVATGRAIATAPACAAVGLAHPGVIALPLRDGPQVRTRLLWRSDDDNPIIDSLVDLATAWTGKGREDGPPP
jgi:DNA-binding transcriptional LysR family regulator